MMYYISQNEEILNCKSLYISFCTLLQIHFKNIRKNMYFSCSLKPHAMYLC